METAASCRKQKYYFSKLIIVQFSLNFPLAMLQNNWFMLLAVRTSRYGCTWEIWRALKKLALTLLLFFFFFLIFCMQRFDSGTCIRNILQPNADSSLKAVNAKETFHAHQVSTRTPCISSKGIPSKVQNSRSAKPSCAELCEY